MYDPLQHPLNDFSGNVEVDGKLEKTINSWGFAALILDTICDPLSAIERPDGLENAMAMAKEIIPLANPDINVDKLLQKCRNKNDAAIKQAHSLIAIGLEIKISKAFEQK